MKKTFLLLSALFFSLLSQVALADGITYIPGNPAKEASGKVYTSHVLPIMEKMYNKVINHKDYSQERETFLETLKQYPDEVNDYEIEEFSILSPLRCAILMNDIELVKAILDAGAFPFLPHLNISLQKDGKTIYLGDKGLFDGKPDIGEQYDIKIVQLIDFAQTQMKMFEKLRQSK